MKNRKKLLQAVISCCQVVMEIQPHALHNQLKTSTDFTDPDGTQCY